MLKLGFIMVSLALLGRRLPLLVPLRSAVVAPVGLCSASSRDHVAGDIIVEQGGNGERIMAEVKLRRDKGRCLWRLGLKEGQELKQTKEEVGEKGPYHFRGRRDRAQDGA